MERKGILFVISGPSGVGKGTLRESLTNSDSVSGLIYSISATTRQPRDGEVHGREYFFVDVPTFEAMIEQEQLLEWANVYNNYYGTPKSFVIENLVAGRDVLLEIDIQGAMNAKKQFPDGVFIFILPPSIEELAERLTKRAKDSEDDISRRLSCYDEEVASLKDYDYLVINDDITEAVDKLRGIIIAERCKINRYCQEG